MTSDIHVLILDRHQNVAGVMSMLYKLISIENQTQSVLSVTMPYLHILKLNMLLFDIVKFRNMFKDTKEVNRRRKSERGVQYNAQKKKDK